MFNPTVHFDRINAVNASAARMLRIIADLDAGSADAKKELGLQLSKQLSDQAAPSINSAIDTARAVIAAVEKTALPADAAVAAELETMRSGLQYLEGTSPAELLRMQSFYAALSTLNELTVRLQSHATPSELAQLVSPASETNGEPFDATILRLIDKVETVFAGRMEPFADLVAEARGQIEAFRSIEDDGEPAPATSSR